jgi:hypothetical protein
LLAWGSLGLGMTLATGCSSTPMASAPPPDPLNGIMVPPGLPQPASAPKADAGAVAPAPQASNIGGVPALPTSFSSSNPATLAGQSRPLEIPNDPGTGPPFLPGGVNRIVQAPSVVGPNASPKVERVPDITPPTGSVLTNQTVQPASANQLTGDDALKKQLEDRGVINQKQECVPEGVRLTCYVSRGEGLPLRIAEVIAADYAAAAQAILQQLPTQP